MSYSSPDQHSGNRSAVLDANELRAMYRRIAESGELGRSRHYQAMLEYLVESSISGHSPKEFELAVEVLGRGADFDVSSDSSVRVCVHQLRKKLDSYYQKCEPDAACQISIPKGQYSIAVVQNQPTVKHKDEPVQDFWRSKLNTSLLVTACLLLIANLGYMALNQNKEIHKEIIPVAQHPIWNPVLGDDKPILLVMGDYYIFGELNANGNIARMVREFNVNSPSDLEDLRFSDIERAENYLDLDLSYMPEGSAFALTRIVPILQASEKPVNITMMSDLTMSDIKNNHIVYIGYISALEKLTQLSFAGSGLQIGRSYDELYNRETTEFYTSDAGLPEEGQAFKDYGLFASYAASVDSQVILISGMRDAGMMHTAQALSNTSSLDKLMLSMESDTDEALSSFEALFEVFGIDRMNFNGNLVYANHLDTEKIWDSWQPSQFN